MVLLNSLSNAEGKHRYAGIDFYRQDWTVHDNSNNNITDQEVNMNPNTTCDT